MGIACLLLFLITDPFAMAEEKTDAEVYVCPMRGKPCPMTESNAPGKCEHCGMNLVTMAKYEEYLKSIYAN